MFMFNQRAPINEFLLISDPSFPHRSERHLDQD